MADGAESPRRRPSIKTASVAASTFSRSASRSTGSLGGGDEQQGRSSNASGDSSPTQQSPRSRRVSRRKSSAASTTSPAGLPTTSAATFLSRFIGNFRSSSSSLGAPRPSLARSVSNPGQPRASSDMGAPPVPSIPGAFPSAAPQSSFYPNSSSTLNRFRPSFTRRATTAGTPSPRGSPAHSPTLSSEAPRGSPGSPATLRGRERDPMETAFGGMRASGGHTQTGSMDSRADSPGLRSTRRGSIVSQATVQAEPGVRTPIAEGHYGSLHPIAEPTAPIPLERPLDLIATLLPPALLLLSHLGPNHLFSPPLVHPLLHQEEGQHHSGRSNSNDSAAPVFNDRASIASSTTSSSSSSFPLLLSTNHITHAYSHELHAPSTLSVPAVSAAAVWRLFRGFEWIGEVGGGTRLPGAELNASGDETDDSATFDFPSALQGVADVLAADAGARGVELVIGQVGSGSAPSPVTTPAVTEEAGAKEKVTESRELLVRGDERAWSVMLIWILHHIIASAAHGATIEVRFLATVIPSPSIPAYASESADSDEAQPPADKRWAVSLEILHTFAATSSSPCAASTPPFDLPLPPFFTPFAKSFFAHLNLDVSPATEHDDSRSWVLSTELSSCKPKAVSDDPSSLLGRRRATLESAAGQEPTMNDLKRFAEVALKGHKVALHAGEQSAFAKHLTAYLAGWGMDVSHVPLDSDEFSGGQPPESLWNKGRREPYGRVDSGFGTQGSSPLTPFDEPTMSPLASLVADNGAPPATSPPEIPSDLIIIDDDIVTLRRLLNNLRAAPTQYPASMMAKRPQLATRRTRSSPHVRQVHQIPAANSSSVILHFASLTQYKAIKDIVQNTLASSRTPTLPEVLVIPKPAGPRRIITALWTAIKRPAVDPSLPPIATSPTSPGVQYWTPRLSPALAKEQEFDFTGSETSGSNREPTSSHSAKPRTPPAYFSTSTVSASNHPPSPLGKISDDQVSYFSVVADGLDGTTPSEGMVIQSPDGRPAIFFQPQTRGSRTERAKEKAARVERSISSDSKDGEDVAVPSARAPMATPHDIGLGQVRRSSASSAILSDPAAAIGTPALTLDSFITAAKSRAVGEEPAEPEPAPVNPAAQLTRQQSTASMISRPPSARPGGSGNTSPRVGTSSPAFAARRMTGGSASTPPMTPAPNSPHVGSQAATTTTSPRPRESSAPGSPGFLQSRRGTLSYGKKAKKPSRKASLATVPPINVLIVEDNPINQTILSMFMKKKGIKYAVAKDGEEAVQKWKAGSFHLVLMDIQLPVKSGIEATREIREMERANNIGTFITTPTTDPSSPLSLGSSSSSGQSSAMSSVLNSPVSPPLSMPVIIVALTASSLQVDRVSALAAGCNDFLTKPVSLQWLQQKLLEWGSMAYLSGFSLMRSNNNSPSTSPSIAPPHTQATHAGFTAGLNSKAEVISAHLHIDPRPHGRSPAASPVRSPARSSSPIPVAGSDPQPPSAVHAIETQVIANGTAVPASPIPLATNPALTISSPTPIVTPKPPAEDNSSTTTVPPPTRQDDSLEPALASLVRIEPSRPADLDTVEQKLEGLAAQRPGPSPLPNDASMSDLTLEGVMAEGARLVGVVDAGRSRLGSAGDSFSKVMHDSGTVSHGGSPDVLHGEESPTS